MEKKTIFLELPCELIERIDNKNTLGDRSAFITELLEKQLEIKPSLKSNIQINHIVDKSIQEFGIAGEINLLKTNGESLGKFNINTLEGFEDLAKKIQEVSEDPAVRIRAKSFF